VFEAAYMATKKLSVCSQQTQRYVISSNRALRGSESINLIVAPHAVHDNSVNRNCAQVGVGGGVKSMVASRIGNTQRNEQCRSYRVLEASKRSHPITKQAQANLNTRR
jgi:hypothetical protein